MESHDKEKVRSFTQLADSIAWDTCHKIYILMDEKQTEQSRSYGYETMYTSAEMDPKQMADTIEEWFDDSCSLRMVDAILSHPNGDKFTSVIEQDI